MKEMWKPVGRTGPRVSTRARASTTVSEIMTRLVTTDHAGQALGQGRGRQPVERGNGVRNMSFRTHQQRPSA